MRYSKFIKRLCILIAFGLLASMTYQAFVSNEQDEISTNINEFVIEENSVTDTQLIHHPHMRSESRSGKLYDIFGQYAKQVSKNHIEIYNATGHTSTRNNSDIHMQAKLIITNENASCIHMHENVKITVDKQNHIHTPYAKIVVNNNTIEGNQNITIFNDHHKITAKEYIYYLDNENIIFNHNVKCKLEDQTLINSHHLTLDQNNKIAYFTGNVIAHHLKSVIKSEHLNAYYNSQGQITFIKSPTQITININNKHVTGKHGTYDIQNGKIHLYDDISLTENNNTINGDIFVYDVHTNKFMIDHKNDTRVEININTDGL